MADADAEATARIMKSASLLVLVAQNSLLAVTMKYSRLNAGDGGELYIASTAVVICEVHKMAISVALLTLGAAADLVIAPAEGVAGRAVVASDDLTLTMRVAAAPPKKRGAAGGSVDGAELGCCSMPAGAGVTKKKGTNGGRRHTPPRIP